MKILAATFATACLLLGAAPTSAQVVITGHGIFADCDSAWDYRNGPLLDMLNAAFANYDAEVEQRIADTIAEFEQHRAAAEAAHTAADADQKQRIALTVGKWLFLELVNKISIDALPSAVTDPYTSGQLEVFKQVIASSNALKVEVAQSIATATPPDTILSDQATDITLGILSSFLGPVGSFLTGAAKAGVDSAVHYWDTQPIKEVAQQEAAMFAAAITKMHAKSKSQKIAEINVVKNEIDGACGG